MNLSSSTKIALYHTNIRTGSAAAVLKRTKINEGITMKKIMQFMLIALLAIGASAQATVVYNNGAPNSSSGNDATAWLQAENFSIAGGAVINHATVYLAGVGGIGSWDGTLNYYFFSNAGGQPGALLASGSGTNVATADTGNPWCCGGNAFAFDFDVNPFAAAAGATYWFGIHTSSDFNRDDIYWVTTNANSANGMESAGGTMNNWYNNGQEHAFSLAGNNRVPEPGTMFLMAAGAFAAFARRRKV